MTSRNWKDTAELIGITAIVASLIFVGLQMRQDRQLARAQAYTELGTSSIELSQLITSNISIWVAGLDGAELSKHDQAAFDQIARAWHMRALTNFYASEHASWGGRDGATRIRVVAYDLYKHPGLRSWFFRFRADFIPRMASYDPQVSDASFSGQVERALAELDELAPPIPDNKTYMLP